LIKAILFDIDNTLLDFDSYVKQSMKEGFSEFGIGEYTEESYEIFEKINTEFWHRIELGTLTYDELLLTRWNTVFSALGLQGDGGVADAG
jgi:FMN phosphatase YigB (HAD superfamily)